MDKKTFKIAVYIVLVISVSIASCKGQQESNAGTTEEQLQKPVKQAVYQSNIFNQSPYGVPVDDFVEIFYEGQVAHWIRSLAVDKQGHVWMGTNHYGVARHDGAVLQYFDEDDGVGNNRINKILVDAAGDVWIATSGGLTLFKNNTFKNYTTADGLPDNGVYGLFIDPQERLWVGTGNGVVYLEDGTFHNFEVPKPKVANPKPSLAADGVGDIFLDREGNFWFAFDGQGITIYDGSAFRFLTEENGLQDNSAGGFYQDQQGGIWISSMNGGISRYANGSFKHFTKEGAVAGLETSAVYEDSQGDLWFAAEHQGVYRYDGETFELFNEDDGLVSRGIITFFEDDQGRFWLGGWKGLFRFDREAAKEGKPSFVAVTQDGGPWN
ncbi:two-component regulator propeller domain-containing protein [Gilvibacter sp.]|uniref:ligand-binding sensor domain-containing protein n=1 Tax=Gilvibacter sp. TaxID=2729997 RepID=UPI0025B80F9B|nr:two-component regulator propeller domain-containing protein [Gilvibacter sp.]NQX77561.1 hypothetical protein [Gilvibacter sp.]